MTKKILHITNSSVKSNFLLSIANLHNKDKYELKIATFGHTGELHKELKKINIQNFSFKISDERLGFLSLFTFISFLRKHKIDIVHVHTFWVSLYFGLASRLAGKKVIMTRHHADSHIKHNKRIHSFIDKISANKIAHKVIAVSNYTRDIMVNEEKVAHQKIKVIYNGLEELTNNNVFNETQFREKLDIKKSDHILVCISRIHPEKSIETIINAIYQTKREDIHLIIAGNGLESDYHKTLVKLSQKLEISSQIHFLGFRNDIKNLLKISAALVHSSLGESFGFTIAEAMQQKTPIIATKLPALEEVATKEVAFFFTPKNIQELQSLILNIVDKKTHLVERLNKGQKRYNNLFTSKTMVEKYEEIYEEI